jgi:hypothetical protein
VRQALGFMLRSVGLWFTVRDGAIYISTQDRLRKEMISTKVEPKDPAVQASLDRKIRAVELPGVSVFEALEILRGPAGRGVNFVIDPGIKPDEKPISVDLRDVTLRQALHSALEPIGLDFITITRDSAIFISTPAGCRREEMQPLNLAVRSYDVGDILAALSQEIGPKANENVADTFLRMVEQLTGAGEWDEVKVPSGGPDADTLPSAPPRMLIQRGNNLMVRHCERIQDQIEKSLAELRAKLKSGEPIRSRAPAPRAPGVAEPIPH